MRGIIRRRKTSLGVPTTSICSVIGSCDMGPTCGVSHVRLTHIKMMTHNQIHSLFSANFFINVDMDENKNTSSNEL